MRAGLLAALALGAAPVVALQAQERIAPESSAADAAPIGQDDIVVTGQQQATPPTRSEVSRQAREITRPASHHDIPLARFQAHLCPGVMGLTLDHALLVVDRIRANAEALDMRMAPADGSCRPNFIVAFVPEGQRQMELFVKNNGHMFRDMPPHERRELLAEGGPVRVWTLTETRSRDGFVVPRPDNPNSPPVMNGWMAHSKIYTATREDIATVMVVFDINQLVGKTLVQLADYATMRGLARTRPVDAEGQPMDTILALFDESAPPPMQMTDFDRAYLASVYDGIPNIPGITKLLGVNRQLRLMEKADEKRE